MDAAVTSIPVLSLLILIVLLVILLTFLFLIAHYVYKDAKRRHMNAPLWTLIVLLAPFCIGFVLYLLARSSHSDLICPKCGASVSDQYTVCPECGTQLQPICPQCQQPIDLSWKYCPWCTAPLDGVEQPSPPQPRQDRFLYRILAVILIAPILLFLLVVSNFVDLRQSGASMYTFGSMDVNTYYTQVSPSVSESVQQWTESLDPQLNCAYALQYELQNSLNNQVEQYILVWAPDVSEGSNVEIHRGLFRSTLELHLTGRKGANSFTFLQYKGTKQLPLTVSLNGVSLTVETQTVSFNPTPFFSMPNFTENPTADALPERFKLTRFVDGENTGIIEIGDPDTMTEILCAIDDAPRVPMDSVPSLNSDETPLLFHITVQYTMGDPESEATFLLFQDGDAYYLQDDRVTNTADGSSIRQMSSDFCRYLEHLFSDASIGS